MPRYLVVLEGTSVESTSRALLLDYDRTYANATDGRPFRQLILRNSNYLQQRQPST